MFSIAYPLPEKVSINGQKYELNMAFDNILRLIEMLSDQELNDREQVETGVYMLVGEVDCDIKEKSDILQSLFKTLINSEASESRELDIAGNPMPVENEGKPPSYSLIEDAEHIFASFYQVYRLDLIEQQGLLHWDKFKALLGGLPDDCIFKQIIDIRTQKLPTGKGTGEQREQLKKLKKQYALKGYEPIEEDV